MFQTPILFMLFNRPVQTAKVLKRILEVRPSRLFISADGPRPGHPEDTERCAAVRSLVEQLPAEIKIERLFHNTNLGCKRAGMTALRWFFDLNEYGIILEDDTLPDPSFFRFVENALIRYADNDRIMLVSGHNPLGFFSTPFDAIINKYPYIWGWGSWRRSWKLYGPDMSGWDSPASSRQIRKWFRSPHAIYFWRRAFLDAANGSQVWDYQLGYSMCMHERLALMSSRNLVVNIGFGGDAVHTRDPSDPRKNMTTFAAPEVLSFPDSTEPDPRFEKALVRTQFFISDVTLWGRVKNAIRPAYRLAKAALGKGVGQAT